MSGTVISKSRSSTRCRGDPGDVYVGFEKGRIKLLAEEMTHGSDAEEPVFKSHARA